METNWQQIIDMNPKGGLRIKAACNVFVHGPINKIEIEKKTNEVIITLDWIIYAKIEENIPFDSWKGYSEIPRIITRFPNKSVGYSIETMPEKGKRITFSGSNIICVEHSVGVIDVSKIAWPKPVPTQITY